MLKIFLKNADVRILRIFNHDQKTFTLFFRRGVRMQYRTKADENVYHVSQD